MSYLINRNVAATALNEAQIEFDVNYRGLGEAKKIIDGLPTVNAIVIPEGATNGDMIKALFPDSELHKESDYISLTFKKGVEIVAYIEDRGASWWNAPYKKGENK